MKESNFQTLFKGWLEKTPPDRSAAYELKLERGMSMPFNRVAKHQIDALQKAKNGGLYHKISDSPVSWMGSTRMRFGKPKPFDCIYMRAVDAYVVVLFYRPRQPKFVYFIDVDKFVEVRDGSKRKSLTSEVAYNIANRIICL